MKNHFFQFFLILCFFVMLSFPSEVFEGAKSGLLLWFLTVLPTLFPFLLISRLLLDSCACSLLNKLLAPVISRLFGISAQGSFAFIVGFLCGYPMGAKITADLFHAHVGDTDYRFGIESVSKVHTAILALRQYGAKEILDKIGADA